VTLLKCCPEKNEPRVKRHVHCPLGKYFQNFRKDSIMTELTGLKPQDFKKPETEDSDSVNKQDQQLTTDNNVDGIASSNTQAVTNEPDFISLNKSGRYAIDHFAMQNFLKEKGFYKLELDLGYAIIQIVDNRCHLVQLHRLKTIIVSEFVSKEKIGYLIKYDKQIFDRGKMDYLTPYKEGFNSDTQETAYIYFRNVVVKLTKNSLPRLLSYPELKKPIWESQVIDRDFELLDKNELPRGEYYQFANIVSDKCEEKFNSLCSTFGYALHGVHNPSQRKAIVYMDEKVPLFPGEKNGGTGKTFATEAFHHFKGNTISIKGSDFNRGNRFAWQQCELTTERVVINETPEEFKFEGLYSEITEGIPVEKKNQGIFKLKNAKIIITTNDMIKGAGSSYRRRIFTFEFADHYNDHYLVIDEFGHLFFIDWPKEQWVLFDNFMVHCQQLYLDNGLIDYERKNVELRKLQETEPELFDFFEDLDSGEYLKRDLLSRFRMIYGYVPISQKKLTLVFRAYCKVNNYYLQERPGAGGANRVFVYNKGMEMGGVKLRQ